MKRPEVHEDKWLLSHPYRRAILGQSAMQIRWAMLRKWFYKRLYEIGKKNRFLRRKIQWVIKNKSLIWCKLIWLRIYYKFIGKHIFFRNWTSPLIEFSKNPGKFVKSLR